MLHSIGCIPAGDYVREAIHRKRNLNCTGVTDRRCNGNFSNTFKSNQNFFQIMDFLRVRNKAKPSCQRVTASGVPGGIKQSK